MFDMFEFSFIIVDPVVFATGVQASSTVVIVSEHNKLQRGCQLNNVNYYFFYISHFFVGVAASIRDMDAAACWPRVSRLTCVYDT